ncbi:hypothetical protein AGLY_009435 [Aphis glycines]|uniref:Uncharacterized protein n=1 Tax=Aphis glycines TaxID=307491 RepID=A0A6G0TIQ6_APHGL|nr:hypothetical protein AGLY_009435 [Aphis glycines]
MVQIALTRSEQGRDYQPSPYKKVLFRTTNHNTAYTKTIPSEGFSGEFKTFRFITDSHQVRRWIGDTMTKITTPHINLHYYHRQYLCQHTTTNDEHNLTSTNYLLDTVAKTFVKRSGDRRPRRRIYQLSFGHSSEDTRETRRRPTNPSVTFGTQQRRQLKIEAAVDNLSLGVQYQRLLHAVLHARSIYHRD